MAESHLAATTAGLLLGATTVESQTDYVTAGQAEAFRLQASASGFTGLAHVYIDSKNKATALFVGVYTNANNHPGLLLSSGSVSSLQLGAWNTVAIAPVQLNAGATYWLAVLGNGGTLRYRDRRSGPCPSETSAQITLTAMPSVWSTGSLYKDCPVSGYITAQETVLSSPEPVEATIASVPASTQPPTISGSPELGQTLTASTGTWSGSPTSYAYQWQECESSGNGCANVAGATAASYALTAADVGHAVRVLLTASNSAGAASAASAAVGPVSAPPPSASFTYSPLAPLTGEPVTLNGTSSTCPYGPCKYEWSDDGSTTQPIPPLWPLGTGATLQFTFSSAGTKYVRLTIADAAGQTATVEHNIVVQAPTATATPPANSAPPTVSGTAQVGQTLTASVGTWSGTTPIVYAYQWRDCNSTGESCSNIAGATAGAYALGESDLGHTVRVSVTATNSAGTATQASSPTATVAAAAISCTTSLTSSTSASSIASAIVSAHDGDTICLASGSYPLIRVVGATHGSYVTVRSAPGGTATIAGMEVLNSSFVRFQGLRMTEGFNMRDTTTAASHDYQFVEDTFEEPLYGIVLYGGSGPIKKVLIEKNYMHRVHLEKPEVEGKCSAGYAQGQDVTMYYAEGVTIAHNVFKEAAWHYIQGGAAGPEGANVEHNLFEGHILMACSHLNLWQIWDGGVNDTFKYNIALGENGQQAATDGVIFENGAGSKECTVKMSNTVIEGNLFVNAATSYELQIYTTEGATIRYNTVVRSEWGTALLTEHCGAGTNYTMTHNVDVEDLGTGKDFNFGECTGTCAFDYNASQDASANQAGSTHYVTGWSPQWGTTAWNPVSEPTPPSGFYIPSGLSLEAGYRGGGGA